MSQQNPVETSVTKKAAPKRRVKAELIPQPASETLLRPTSEVVDLILSVARQANAIQQPVRHEEISVTKAGRQPCEKPRAKRVLTEEQRQVLSERLKKAREVRASKKLN